MSIKRWIIDWIVKNSSISKDILETKLSDNYLEEGWIDSLQFVSFVTEIEDKFNIKFLNEEFQNPEFSTIIGLSKIIEKKQNE